MPIRCEIVSQDRTVFEGDVDIVVAPGTDGEMGILPHHAPLLTAIAHAGVVAITETDGRRVELFASDGFAQMRNNVLTLVCDWPRRMPSLIALRSRWMRSFRAPVGASSRSAWRGR